MRTRCATGLRYSPKNVSQPSKGRGLLARKAADRPSAADGAELGVGVLVVELVTDALGDVDDLGTRVRLGGVRDQPGGHAGPRRAPRRGFGLAPGFRLPGVAGLDGEEFPRLGIG